MSLGSDGSVGKVEEHVSELDRFLDSEKRNYKFSYIAQCIGLKDFSVFLLMQFMKKIVCFTPKIKVVKGLGTINWQLLIKNRGFKLASTWFRD